MNNKLLQKHCVFRKSKISFKLYNKINFLTKTNFIKIKHLRNQLRKKF